MTDWLPVQHCLCAHIERRIETERERERKKEEKRTWLLQGGCQMRGTTERWRREKKNSTDREKYDQVTEICLNDSWWKTERKIQLVCRWWTYMYISYTLYTVTQHTCYVRYNYSKVNWAHSLFAFCEVLSCIPVCWILKYSGVLMVQSGWWFSSSRDTEHREKYLRNYGCQVDGLRQRKKVGQRRLVSKGAVHVGEWERIWERETAWLPSWWIERGRERE